MAAQARIEKGQRVIHENGTHGVAGIRDPRHNGVVRYMPDVLYLPDGAPRDTGWIWVPEAYLRPEKAEQKAA